MARGIFCIIIGCLLLYGSIGGLADIGRIFFFGFVSSFFCFGLGIHWIRQARRT